MNNNDPMNLGLKMWSGSRERLHLLLADALFTQVPLLLIPLGVNSETLVNVETGQPTVASPLESIDFIVDNVLRVQDHSLRNFVVMTFDKNETWEAYLQGIGALTPEYTAHAILADSLSGSTRVRHYVSNLGSILHGEVFRFDNTLVLSPRQLYVLPDNL